MRRTVTRTAWRASVRARSAWVLAWALALSLARPPAATAQEVSSDDIFLKSLRATYQALAQYGSYDDLDELRRVNDIGYRIAQESGFRQYPFSFHIIDMPEPNAFALPGGHIFVTRGMLELDLDDDMLAGLLGHEVAHVVLQHGIRMSRRATLLNALSQAILVGVMVAASDDDNRQSGPYYDPRDPRNAPSGTGDLVQGTYAAGIVVTELLMRGYSREFEDEADEEGQRWAAGAGFDPDGTRALMARMQARIPQTKDYGYWQTHPFYDQRVRAADVRRKLLVTKETRSTDAYREQTQGLLLDFREHPKVDEPLIELLDWQALNAWPQGPRADRLRLDYLEEIRQAELDQPELGQDLGALIQAYEDERSEVRELTPESPFLATTEREIESLRALLAERRSAFEETLDTGIYETEFLETYLSNYPDSDRVSQVALALGDAYSRSRRQTEAVAWYLEAWEADPESEAGKRARGGLRQLVGHLDRLGALQQLADQQDDAELRRLAEERLDSLAGQYKSLDNGAEYLKRFPRTTYSPRINERLDQLANEMLGELILYQAVGDNVKALERIRQILMYAPLSPAAERLRQGAVLEG
jgi:Zn-dependent protease with chaperone function